MGSSVKGTTILAVRRDGHVAIAGDGQITTGDVVLKRGAKQSIVNRTQLHQLSTDAIASSVADTEDFSIIEAHHPYN